MRPRNFANARLAVMPALNPARCFGIMAASNFTSYHWIHWLGPVMAAGVHGLFYALVPSGRNQEYQVSHTQKDLSPSFQIKCETDVSALSLYGRKGDIMTIGSTVTWRYHHERL